MRKFFALITIIFAFNAFVKAQQWMRDMYDPTINFYTVQKEFNEWWIGHKDEILKEEQEEKNEQYSKYDESYCIYKRWEYDIEPRMRRTGGNRQWQDSAKAIELYRNSSFAYKNRSSNSWHYIGEGKSQLHKGKNNGRLNAVRLDPIDANVLYVCAPSGGLWKSNDKGNSWTVLNTDYLPCIGVSDIAINPSNNQILYIATGDFAASTIESAGVYKSTNGGQTWDTTGFVWPINTFNKYISKILIHPQCHDTLLIASSKGIYLSKNAGNSWTQVCADTWFKDMEWKPKSSKTVYACTEKLVYKSTDGGQTWIALTNGLPNSTVAGYCIGVTPSDTNCVYVLATNNTGGYLGLYRSLDAGQSFVLQSNTPDIITRQGNYNFAVAVSPINKNIVMAAGVSPYQSKDGGVTWSNASLGIHPDMHDILFDPINFNRVYIANDGGIYQSNDTGLTWKAINDDIVARQIYKISSSTQTRNLVLNGSQDNGTLLRDSQEVKYVGGGDGMQCIIDPVDENIQYYASQNGWISKSIDRGLSSISIVTSFGSGINRSGPWITPYVLNPKNHNTIILGKDSLYISRDGGASWKSLNAPVVVGQYRTIAIAPSDSNYIYASSSDSLYKSINGGLSFTNISQNLLYPGSMVIDETNPNKLWVCDINTVHYSTTGGTTPYTSLSTGLSSAFIPEAMTRLNHSADALYVCMQDFGGVYYRDSTMSSWVAINSGLPNVPIYDIGISYPAGKIRVGTYGRDLWETDVVNNWYNHTKASFLTSNRNACVRESIQFTDQSSFSPTSWSWSFPNGIPAVSTQQNPTVSYATQGSYTIQLIATNNMGSDTIRQTNYINVLSKPQVTATISDSIICIGDSISLRANGANNYQWSNTYNHATNVLGTDSFYTIKPQVGSTAFTLVGWNALGCNDTITRQVSTSICNGIESLNDNTELTIMPNPTTGIFVMEYRSTVYGKLKITLRSMNGHLAFETESNKRNDLFRYEYNGSNLSRGIYILTVTINNKGINRRVVLK